MKLRPALVSALLVAALGLTSPAAAQDVASERLSGEDRYATSAAISRSHVAPGAEVVYLASGEDYPDALSAAPVAGMSGAPVLLVKDDGIPEVVETELDRLRPDRVVVLGGESAAGRQVVTDLDDDVQVTRVAGADRYATSAALSAETFASGVDVAYVASGTAYPDALAGAALAGRDDAPLLLVGDKVSNAVAAELTRLQPGRIVVLGGIDAVAPRVATQLERFTTGAVTRLGGGNRYETAAVIARTGGPAGTAFLASGATFADALAGAPMAAAAGAPVLLTKPTALPDDSAAALGDLAPARLVTLGGEAAVSDAVRHAAVAAAQGEAPTPTPALPAGYDGRMVELINAERAAAGVPPLTYWDPLRTGALAHSRWMQETGSFVHASSSQLRDDVHAAGCSRAWGENIYTSSGWAADPSRAMTAYLNSPGHRANILSPDFAYVATGTVVSGGDVHNTQRFAGVCD